MNPTFKHVEDYIEFIGGYRAADGKQYGMFSTVPSPLSLARYDVSIIDSLSAQTCESNKGYTDKQAALAVRLINNYRKQLNKLSIVVPEVLDQFRLAIRQVDRSKRIYIEDDKFIAKFPFETKLIDTVKNEIKKGNGSAKFDYDHKVWRLGMTEHTLNWLMTIAPQFNFDVDENVTQLYNALLETEKTPYSIELVRGETEFYIKNAPQSLTDYINEHLGGFGFDNELTLIDNAEVLGYKFDPWLASALFDKYGFNKTSLIAFRNFSFKQDSCSLAEIIEYARELNRLPVYVYTTGLPKKDTDEVVYLNRNKSAETVPKILVSNSAMMIGNKKQAWLNNAEKVFILE